MAEKNVECIELQYELMDFVSSKSKEELKKYMDEKHQILRGDIDFNLEYIGELRVEIWKMRFQRLFGSCFTRSFDGVDWYQHYISILGREINLLCDFAYYYREMGKYLDDDNVSTMEKLSQFVGEKFVSNMSYIQEDHRLYDEVKNGVCRCSNEYIDDQDAFHVFFEEKMKSIIQSKKASSLEKKYGII